MKNHDSKVPTIPQPDLEVSRGLLFNKARFSGAEISRLIKRDLSSLWTDFHKRGLSAERAGQIAAILDGWSKELKECAQSLRLLATKARADYKAKNANAAKKPL